MFFILLLALVWPLASIWGCSRLRGVSSLKLDPVHHTGPWPTVSVLVPARNEELTLAPALESLRTLDYPNLEIILINDRSTDRTLEVMQRVASRDERVRVVEVDQLPTGWMGKANALQLGLGHATGEWILFTDADVVFDPQSLKKAVTHVLTHGLDHLALAVHFIFSTPWIAPFCSFCVAIMGLVTNFKNIDNPSTKDAMGVGAFQIVRRSALDKTEGLAWLRMEPIEDVGLARMLKNSGAKVSFLAGRNEVKVDWYPTFGALLKGAGSRSMVVARYRYKLLLIKIILSTVGCLAPILVILHGGIAAAVVVFAWAVASACIAYEGNRVMGIPKRWGCLMPVGAVMFLICLVYSCIQSLRVGGLYWRGRVYPLAELRELQRVRI